QSRLGHASIPFGQNRDSACGELRSQRRRVRVTMQPCLHFPQAPSAQLLRPMMRNVTLSSVYHSLILASALTVLLCATTAQADPIEAFYKGRTVTVVTSTGVGGPFDLTARALAKYMPKYLPGRPLMIVRNMPGGGNVLATNYMFTQAPKDGT